MSIVTSKTTYSALRSHTIARTVQSLSALPSRLVAEARMAIPKLQLLEEDSDDSPATQAWDKSLPKKVLELAARMATVTQAHSEWHRRMTSEKLNQANRPFDDGQLQVGTNVYFYKPPSQQEVSISQGA
jgi:hypothetical protein